MNIRPANLKSLSVEFTKDPQWCVQNLYPLVPLPSPEAYVSAVKATWEHRVCQRLSTLLKERGFPGEVELDEDAYWLNACNVCEDAAADIFKTPTTAEGMLEAMVYDYRANVQGAVHGPGSAGKEFVTGSVESAARKLLANMFG